jgi:dipeptidyl aminopeptidase/acylaminoacyl peptidase
MSFRAAWILLAALSGAAAKVPLTHEAMWLMKRVGAPVPTPDGRWVVVSVVEPAYDEKDQVSDLWIVPADGSAKPRRLTFTKGGESGLAWSPDSRRLAFTARREGDEASQVYLLDVVAGGEAQRVTSLAGGASAPRWRPDGGALLFTGAVDPQAAERKARKYRARVYTGFPIRNWDHWLDDAQTRLFVQSLEPGAQARDLLCGTKLVAQPGFGGRPSPMGGPDNLDAVWAPDGQSVLFAATTNRNAAAYDSVDTHLYQVAPAGGEPRQLTAGRGRYSRPVFRPDGHALYCLFERHTAKIYNLERLAMVEWPTPGQPQVFTEAWDRSVNGFAFSPDSKTVFLTAEEAGHEKLFALPASGGPVRTVMDMTTGACTNLAAAEKAPAAMPVANWESALNPPEVIRVNPVTGKHTFLTEFNREAAAQIDWQPLRHFWFTSRRGKRIHNMIALPPGFDETNQYPLLALIHGGPHNMWRDQFVLRWNYHLLAAPGYVVLLTNYTGSTGFGEKFAQEIQGDPLKGPGEEINEAADEAIRRFPFIDGTRQAAGGASYGGHMANWLQATTTRYKCLISHAGLVNLESQWGTSDMIYHRELSAGGPPWEQGPVWREQNPIRYAKNFRTPILVTVGERDYRVPLNQALENWSVLQRMRVPSRLLVFENANHWILNGEDSRFFYQEVQEWLRKHLRE